ncbi:MAG: winged helix-turn-helix transcriptional regulator [Candidatus Methanomethyliaceae archaeon]|nr:winged helix-turn-helix transcriptional regulator [Candidatus Methanomethyliaceae archaeon]MDW7971466.1 winged helix-turn-helix transcriptional regulator [Nitrososphaerota archaeon]
MSNDREVLEEIKLGLIAIRRDIIERLRRIEEYISFIDSDVGRLRLEIQRIDEKLREIFSEEEQKYKLQKIEPIVKKISEKKAEIIKTTPSNKRTTLNQTEIAIIKYLIENPGTKSATPIAQSIGKAREHVARTLKKLADEKIIIRDENTWPYTYIVPEETKKLVM